MGGGREPEPTGLTHIGPDGAARMVDVGAKAESERRAVAEARVRMQPATARAVEAGDGPKGDVLGTARIAGIGAAKRAGTLVPLAHPLPLSFADVGIAVDVDAGIVTVTAEARCVGRTGVEIEAMAAAAIAALTDLRHGQGARAGRRDRARPPAPQERRQERRVERRRWLRRRGRRS